MARNGVNANAVVTQYGRHRIQGNPLGNGRYQDANTSVGPYLGAGAPALRQGASELLQHQTGRLVQGIAAPWTGSNFGGNNPAVVPVCNIEIRQTRVIDRDFLMVGDTEEGCWVFTSKHSAEMPKDTSRPQPIIQNKHHVLSLGRFNYYLRYGPGRQRYRGYYKTGMDIQADWGFDGVQKNKMPPASTANFKDSIAVTMFIAGYFEGSDVWVVNRSFQGGVDVNLAQCNDFLFFVLRKVHESNPYTRLAQGKDYDVQQEKSRDLDTESQYYWTVVPVTSKSPALDPSQYTNSNPMTPEANYVGAYWRVGMLVARVLRDVKTSAWESVARRAVYPDRLDSDHLQAHAELPKLEIKS